VLGSRLVKRQVVRIESYKHPFFRRGEGQLVWIG
jgi:hypothetical protein